MSAPHYFERQHPDVPPLAASRYFGDTRRLGPCTRTTPGVVPNTITSSPSGATNKPNDAPSATVYVPEQSGLTVYVMSNTLRSGSDNCRSMLCPLLLPVAKSLSLTSA